MMGGSKQNKHRMSEVHLQSFTGRNEDFSDQTHQQLFDELIIHTYVSILLAACLKSIMIIDAVSSVVSVKTLLPPSG